MFSEKWKKEIFTVPNLLSLLRITLIPVYITVYRGAVNQRQYLLAGFILAFSCLTDMADGFIARKYHRISNVGKILDPLADKLTQFALILSLAAKYSGLYWVLTLFLVKELFQSGALVFFAQKGKALPGALPAGKLCTTALFFSLIFLVMFPKMHSTAVLLVILSDAVFLLYAFGCYMAAYFGKHCCLTDFNQHE